MKRFVIGVLVIGGVIAAIALIIRKRSGSDVDEWNSFAEDAYTRASTSVTKLSDSATDAVSKVADTAKDEAAKGSGAASGTATKVSDAAKKA